MPIQRVGDLSPVRILLLQVAQLPAQGVRTRSVPLPETLHSPSYPGCAWGPGYSAGDSEPGTQQGHLAGG